jgi:predicted transcriptional regulator of viral defense system
MAKTLGEFETQALAYSQSRDKRSIEAGELVRDLRWSAEQERKVLSRLARKGLIVRVRRGLYLVPPRLPAGGRWGPSEFLALSALIDDRGGRYQISGPSTFYRYGWTEQIPNRVYAYNNRISGDRQVGSTALTLIKVADKRLGGTEAVQTPEGIEVVYASKARSLMDAVYDWSRFDSLPRAFDWAKAEIESDDSFASQLVQVTIQFGNQATVRRIGALLEQAGTQDQLLRRLDRNLRPSQSFIPMVPLAEKRGKPERGKTSKRWGVVFNYE